MTKPIAALVFTICLVLTASGALPAKGEQLAEANLCEQLFGSFTIKLTLTPTASAKKILGTKYSVELRSPGLDIASWNKSISEKRWLDALRLIASRPVTRFPSPEELEGLRLKLLRKEFTAFVKTKADLSHTHAVSLSEVVKLDTERLYADGIPVAGWKGSSLWPTSSWTRHPDGTGWHVPWWYVYGELIIAPGAYSPAPKGPSYEFQNKVLKAGKPLLTQHNDGILQVLEQRRKLAELTNDEIIEALDKACLERYRARRRVALAQ